MKRMIAAVMLLSVVAITSPASATSVGTITPWHYPKMTTVKEHALNWYNARVDSSTSATKAYATKVWCGQYFGAMHAGWADVGDYQCVVWGNVPGADVQLALGAFWVSAYGMCGVNYLQTMVGKCTSPVTTDWIINDLTKLGE